MIFLFCWSDWEFAWLQVAELASQKCPKPGFERCFKYIGHCIGPSTQHHFAGVFRPLMSHQPPLFRAGESWPAIAWSGFQFGEWQPRAVVRNGSGSGGNFSPKPEILAPIFGTHTQPFILRAASIIKTKFSFSDVLNILHWPLLVICWERFFRTLCRG